MKKVVSMVVGREGKMLLVRDREGEFWIFPGGKVEEGESLRQALKREVKEELPGVSIFGLLKFADIESTTPHSKVKVRIIAFTADIRGSIEPSGEITDSRWVPLEDIPNLNITEGTRDILTVINELKGRS